MRQRRQARATTLNALLIFDQRLLEIFTALLCTNRRVVDYIHSMHVLSLGVIQIL
jgi:hypothetical protein